MNRDYDWLMMVMGKLMRQCDRGLITRKEFNDELWLVLATHRRWVMSSTHYVRDGKYLRVNRADGKQGDIAITFTDQSEGEIRKIIQGMEENAEAMVRGKYTRP